MPSKWVWYKDKDWSKIKKKRSVNLNLTAGQCELMKSSEFVVPWAILLWKCHLPTPIGANFVV